MLCVPGLFVKCGHAGGGDGSITLALGGKADARLSALLGRDGSGDTLLRLLRRLPPAAPQEPLSVVGIDDWARSARAPLLTPAVLRLSMWRTDHPCELIGRIELDAGGRPTDSAQAPLPLVRMGG